MIVFRLSKSRYAKDLSGAGSEKSGGRWNSKGTPLLYTSESRALCTTEIAVHIPLGIVPNDYKLISIETPENSIHSLELDDLPVNWNTLPHIDATQQIGDKFVNEGEFLILKVPSVVVNGDFNFLINPRHEDFKRLKIINIELFVFDQRLFK